MLTPHCPLCSTPTAAEFSLCGVCGTAYDPPGPVTAQRNCLEALHQCIAGAEDRGADPLTVARAQDRLLRDGYLPDDGELLLAEASWCLSWIDGVGSYSDAAGARYQSCVNKYEQLRLTAAAAARASADAGSRTGVIRRRRLLWRLILGAPALAALRLLRALGNILLTRCWHRLKLRSGAVPPAPVPHRAAGKIPG